VKAGIGVIVSVGVDVSASVLAVVGVLPGVIVKLTTFDVPKIVVGARFVPPIKPQAAIEMPHIIKSSNMMQCFDFIDISPYYSNATNGRCNSLHGTRPNLTLLRANFPNSSAYHLGKTESAAIGTEKPLSAV